MQAIRHVWSNFGFWLSGEDKRVLTPKKIKQRARLNKPLPAHIIIDMDDDAELNNVYLPQHILEIRNTAFTGSHLCTKEIRSCDTAPNTRFDTRKNFALDDYKTEHLILDNKKDVTLNNVSLMVHHKLCVENTGSLTVTKTKGLNDLHINNIDICTLKHNEHLHKLHIGDKGCRTLHVGSNPKLTDFESVNPRYTMQATFHDNPKLKEWHTQSAPNADMRRPPIFVRQLPSGASVMAANHYYIIHNPLLKKSVSNHKNKNIAGTLDYVRANLDDIHKKSSFFDDLEGMPRRNVPKKEYVSPASLLLTTLQEAHPRHAPQP